MNDLQSPITFLKTRRSYPPAILGAPFPNQDEIIEIAEMGLRVPDHKKLEPWRLVAMTGTSLDKLATLVEMHAPSYQPDQAKAAKITKAYKDAGCVVALVYAPKYEPSVPRWEQELSVGAAGISLVNAAIAKGFGANWLTGFLPECLEICAYIGLNEDENLRGLIHIGTPQSEPPERPRPDITQKLKFL